MIDATDFAERAAILEYDNGKSRADAEAQALREMYADRMATKAPGILGELIVAARQLYIPNLLAEAGTQGLNRTRVPWGFDWVVPEGATYRPADSGEQVRPALIVPAVMDGCIADLVAQGLNSGSLLTRLGVASVVGDDEIELARSTRQPLYVYSSPLAWLRGGTRGAIILDWPHVGRELEGVETMICSEAIAARLHAGTRNCFPVPAIATPSVSENRRAA